MRAVRSIALSQLLAVDGLPCGRDTPWGGSVVALLNGACTHGDHLFA